MLNLIDGALSLIGHLLETHPHQESAGDVIAEDAIESALAVTQARQLFDFTMKLLNLVAPTTHLLCRRRPVLSQIVGNDEIALSGRKVKAKEFHREVRSSFEVDPFAAAQLFGRPDQCVDPTKNTALIVRAADVAIVFERAVKRFALIGNVGLSRKCGHTDKIQVFHGT